MSRDLYPGVGYGLMLAQSVYTVGVHIVLMVCRCSVQHYSYCTGSVKSKRVFCNVGSTCVHVTLLSVCNMQDVTLV